VRLPKAVHRPPNRGNSRETLAAVLGSATWGDGQAGKRVRGPRDARGSSSDRSSNQRML
jgi:hypothetical protein